MIFRTASIYSIKCTAMESMNTWQKIYEENKDDNKFTILYIFTS